MFSQSDSFEEKLRLGTGREGFANWGAYGGRQHPMHRHAELEFNLVTRGTGRYILGDRCYNLGPRSLVWLFPAQDHILLDRSPDYAHWVLVFRPELVTRAAGDEHPPLREGNPAGYFCRRLRPDDDARLRGLLETVAGVPRAETARFNAGLAFALLTAWAAYRDAEEGAAGTGLHPAVERTVKFLRTHSAGDHAAREVADACGLSAAHLARLFRAQVGVTLIEFRNRERIKRFLEADARGTTLLESALSVGFGSYAQFHRVFSDTMGFSPSEYRRRVAGHLRELTGRRADNGKHETR
jgi:methylphosphotriester-DNA--protein-cysteine methyltransferase